LYLAPSIPNSFRRSRLRSFPLVPLRKFSREHDAEGLRDAKPVLPQARDAARSLAPPDGEGAYCACGARMGIAAHHDLARPDKSLLQEQQVQMPDLPTSKKWGSP